MNKLFSEPNKKKNNKKKVVEIENEKASNEELFSIYGYCQIRRQFSPQKKHCIFFYEFCSVGLALMISTDCSSCVA